VPTLAESLYRHSAWATERLVEVCEELSDEQLDAPHPSTAGSIRETLVHTLSAEQYYLERIGRELPTDRVQEGEAFPGFDALRRAALANGEAFAEATTAVSPDEMVPGRPGDSFTQAAASVFQIQALNHSAEHRTQIFSILSSLGAGPPALSEQLDGWSWGGASGTLHPRSE
jgi:uncharacterized damage-inducible protein DinB